jgi:hypothetical protein
MAIKMVALAESKRENGIVTTHTMEVRPGTPKVGELARIKATGQILEVTTVAGEQVTMVTPWTWKPARGEGHTSHVTHAAHEVERIEVTSVQERWEEGA